MKRAAVGGLLVVAAALGVVSLNSEAAEKKTVDDAAVQRTRETVQLLDDVYKGFVVQITGTYVGAQEKTPAATVAHKVFQYVEEKGHGHTRLIDATGHPVRKANAAKTDFERKAVAQLKEGKSYYEEIGEKDGKPVLRAATVVPVVMKQCIACHEGHKEGDLLGALVYELPIK